MDVFKAFDRRSVGRDGLCRVFFRLEIGRVSQTCSSFCVGDLRFWSRSMPGPDRSRNSLIDEKTKLLARLAALEQQLQVLDGHADALELDSDDASAPGEAGSGGHGLQRVNGGTAAGALPPSGSAPAAMPAQSE